MMDLFEAMEKRRSVRDFDPARDVPIEMIEEILRCACLAPSAGNVQPWRFCVIRDRGLKEKLAEAALGQAFVASAPVVIVVCADLKAHAAAYGKRGVELYSIQDTAAAIQNLLLAATSLGLGSCWVGAFREGEAAAALGLEESLRPLAIIPLGYPRSSSRRANRMDHRRLTVYM